MLCLLVYCAFVWQRDCHDQHLVLMPNKTKILQEIFNMKYIHTYVVIFSWLGIGEVPSLLKVGAVIAKTKYCHEKNI